MILIGQLEGAGPENLDFFGAWNGNERSELPFGPQKVDVYAPQQNHKGQAPYQKQVHW